jgi:hypothetical protein
MSELRHTHKPAPARPTLEGSASGARCWLPQLTALLGDNAAAKPRLAAVCALVISNDAAWSVSSKIVRLHSACCGEVGWWYLSQYVPAAATTAESLRHGERHITLSKTHQDTI